MQAGVLQVRVRTVALRSLAGQAGTEASVEAPPEDRVGRPQQEVEPVVQVVRLVPVESPAGFSVAPVVHQVARAEPVAVAVAVAEEA